MLLHQALMVGRVRGVSEGHLEFAYVQVSLKQNVSRKESHVKEWKGWKDVLVSLQVKVKYHSRVFLAKNRLLFKLYAIWQMCVLGWPCWIILQMHPQLWNPLQHTFKCIVGTLVPPAILSAFAGAMSSREDLGRCPLLQGQTGVACCLSSLAGQTVCRRQADTSDKVPVATLNSEPSWDSCSENKVTHTVFCARTPKRCERVLVLAFRMDPVAKAFGFPAPEWPVKCQPLQKALLIAADLWNEVAFCGIAVTNNVSLSD